MTEFGKFLIIMTLMFYFLTMIEKIDMVLINIKQTNVIIETQLKELNQTLKSWEVKVEQSAEQHP